MCLGVTKLRKFAKRTAYFFMAAGETCPASNVILICNTNSWKSRFAHNRVIQTFAEMESGTTPCSLLA
jgi:hypothetical protein